MNLKLFIFCIYLIKLTLCADWNYDTLGPDYWKVAPIADNKCNGRMQSPINIVTNAVAYDKSLSDISFNNYDAEINWEVKNTGYTATKKADDTKPVPSITGSNYGKTFSLLQWHLHWGYNIYQGSEHLIDNVKYPLEIHLVHKAADNTLAVVGFIFEVVSTPNANLDPMLASIRSVPLAASAAASLLFNLMKIIPSSTTLSKTGYYRYIGSLTTPPCTEGIIWTVYNTKISISETQLRENFYTPNVVKTNFREDQQLFSRLVYSSINNNGNYNSLNSFISIFIIFLGFLLCGEFI